MNLVKRYIHQGSGLQLRLCSNATSRCHSAWSSPPPLVRDSPGMGAKVDAILLRPSHMVCHAPRSPWFQVCIAICAKLLTLYC